MNSRMDISARKHEIEKQLEKFKEKGCGYNLARGNPGPEQLDLSLSLLDTINSRNFNQETMSDIRNYGPIDGLQEAKQLFAQYLDVESDEIIVGGNSSLNLMHDIMRICLINGTEDNGPWLWHDQPKFLCPAPGYDRHFSICQSMGVEMLPVEMGPCGPNLDQVQSLVSEDSSIKGIWCVPKFSNPTGICYSSETVEKLASMETAANDFRIFWDNAYAVHDFTEEFEVVDNILRACERFGNSHRVYVFGSTSKLTFPGAGVAFFASSRKNVKFIKSQLSYQTIGPDKINQLRQLAFFKDVDGIKQHARKHGEILKEKFDVVISSLQKYFGNSGIAEWSNPKGGYFISLNTEPGCATKVIALAQEVGLTLMPAGSTFPYREDPLDRNIRLAPSASSLTQLPVAIAILCQCIEYISLEQKS